MPGGMEQLSYEDRELGLFRLEKRRLQGNLFMILQYLKWAYTKAGERLYERVCTVSTKRNSFKLREDIFILNIRKKLFTVRLPREPVDGPLPGSVQS